jgi:hypothetical protein
MKSRVMRKEGRRNIAVDTNSKTAVKMVGNEWK